MNSVLLKSVACGLIVFVLASTLWMAQVVQPERAGPQLLLAQVEAPAAPASAPSSR